MKTLGPIAHSARQLKERLAAKLAGQSLPLAKGKPRSNEPVVDAPPHHVSLNAQWTRLEGHLQTEMARTQSVLAMQDTAALHLDAAHYALDRIAIELVDVMPSIVDVADVDMDQIEAVRQETIASTGDGAAKRPAIAA